MAQCWCHGNYRSSECEIRMVVSVVVPTLLSRFHLSLAPSCCSRRIYLRFSRTSIAQGLSGTPKISNFWGEEKWRQAKHRIASFILQAHFDEGAVAIYYGVHRASATSEIRFV